MPKDSKSVNPAQLLRQLQDSDEMRHEQVALAGLEPRLALLRGWQAGRLGRSYADLIADKHAGPACRFFLTDIYGPRDFTQRDHDAERLHAILARVLPAPMLKQLVDVIELNRLSAALDQQLLAMLFEQMGVSDAISAEAYVEGYRRCDNQAERGQQIDLIVKVLSEAAQGARWPGVGPALAMIGGPARKAGWVELYEFLKRGHDAFKRIKDVKAFVATIERRERRILTRIYAEHPDPFGE